MQGDSVVRTLGGRFDSTAARYPENMAVIYEGQAVTYRELQLKADALCSALRSRGITASSRVGILSERCLDWVVAMMAVVKAGAAYVPLSADDPLTQIESLVADVQVELILTDLYASLPFLPAMSIRDIPAELTATVADPAASGGSLAYIMFTSGTTGKPKGVGVTHENILNLTVEPDYVRLDASTRILQTGAPTFDASTFEVWGALLNGGTLIIPSKRGLTDFGYMEQNIQQHGVTTMWLTSPLFTIAAEHNPRMFEGIRELIVGGDVVSPVAVNKVYEACGNISILNGYGPTECTTFSAVYSIPRNHGSEPVPIGRPFNNVQAYILDEDNRPVRQGDIGELHIGGKGVSLGYVNRPDLNEEVFIVNPFGPGKLYKTGDRVSEDAAGIIHYYGRKDRQVKIRGYRIELSAVEAMLELVEEVESAAACVLTNRAGANEICACVTVRDAAASSRDDIRHRFAVIAPSHIVLSHIVIVDSLPLNKNGKIDYKEIKVLLEAEASASQGALADSEGGTAEDIVMNILSNRTGFPVPDSSTSFFDLGIDSLTAVYLARDINNEFGTNINAVDILAHPTIADLMPLLGRQPVVDAKNADVSRPRSEEQKLPVLNQQKPLLVDYHLNPSSVRYNVPLVFRLSRETSIPRLTDALYKTIERHGALRVQFANSGLTPFQTTLELVDFTIPRLHGSPNLQELIQPFNLTAGLPFRFAVGEDGDGVWLFMDFHHIAVDGASLAVIVKDVNRFYQGHQLEELTDSFAAVVEQSNAEFLRSCDSCAAYWQNYLQYYKGMNELPVDKVDDDIISHRSHLFRFAVDEQRTTALRAWSQQQHITLFEGILLAYACTLHAVTSGSEVMFATPSRDYTVVTNEPAVAMLTHTLWVYSEVKEDQSILDYMGTFIKGLRESQRYMDVPIDVMRELVARNRQEPGTAVVDTLIAYHNVQDMQAELCGTPVRLKPIAPEDGMFPLNLQIFDCATHLEAEWEYMADLFEYDTVASLGEMFTVMVDLLTRHKPQSAQKMPDLVAACIQEQLA
ncbi:hypothetical protein DNH61_11280 [Paenibacillus sambharensis]|uniref:Carrier domain-containing protein n=1 Tax=Paenibacillus sambharensis TaxID=1803190 RepID=A0A2W1LM07_9BACL|nr:non-ribosomal peptide synthetase [Paenibacillus sambharensis]PZD96002.1 hypothetical protein DNH61_11280 [Paenibacillus sambharensis]